MLVPLAEADCLLIREPHAPTAKAGSRCTILKLGLWPFFEFFTSN
jgi:hypothetical protein